MTQGAESEYVALTPKLTPGDRRVLRALPSCDWREVRERTDLLTVWQVAEVLKTYDVRDVEMTLNGLQRMSLAASARSKLRNRRVWWRTGLGDEELS